MRLTAVYAMAAVCAAQTLAALGGEPVVSSKNVMAPPPPPASYFRANEVSLGAFATYVKGLGDHDRGYGEHAWGGGLSLAYFPSLYAGVRVQGGGLALFPSHNSADNAAGFVSGDFLLRYPLDLKWPRVHLAPYAIAGVGGLTSSGLGGSGFGG